MVESEPDAQRGSRHQCIGYPRFVAQLDESPNSHSGPGALATICNAPSARSRRPVSRFTELQNTLVDLIEFLDDPPSVSCARAARGSRFSACSLLATRLVLVPRFFLGATRRRRSTQRLDFTGQTMSRRGYSERDRNCGGGKSRRRSRPLRCSAPGDTSRGGRFPVPSPTHAGVVQRQNISFPSCSVSIPE